MRKLLVIFLIALSPLVPAQELKTFFNGELANAEDLIVGIHIETQGFQPKVFCPSGGENEGQRGEMARFHNESRSSMPLTSAGSSNGYGCRFIVLVH